jgi:hypothetical protein
MGRDPAKIILVRKIHFNVLSVLASFLVSLLDCCLGFLGLFFFGLKESLSLAVQEDIFDSPFYFDKLWSYSRLAIDGHHDYNGTSHPTCDS